MNLQGSLFDDNPEYEAFEAKFKPKLTTDDCYTPQPVYDAVAAWVAQEYKLDPASFVRPFWPGGDFESFDYPPGCVVVDNPPFSIFTAIMMFYQARGISFFLFGPALTLFSGGIRGVCYIPVGVTITYENGAQVITSFSTNLDRYRVRSAPELYQAVDLANKKLQAEGKAILPKYNYPDHLVTAAMVQRYSHYGVDFCVAENETRFVRGLDSQKAAGKTVFGGGFLLSNHAAAEKAAAEKATAEKATVTVWPLSIKERGIISELSGGIADTDGNEYSDTIFDMEVAQ